MNGDNLVAFISVRKGFQHARRQRKCKYQGDCIVDKTRKLRFFVLLG